MQINDRHKLLQQLGINNDLAKARPLMTNYIDVVYYCNSDRPIGFKPALLERQAENTLSYEFKQIACRSSIDAAIDNALEYERKSKEYVYTGGLFTIINQYTGKRVN